MQAKLSRQEEKQALAELKAHKVALASMERRLSAALSRKDPCALAWLSALRESFAQGTSLEVRERNLQRIYTCLYKLDPKAPIPDCCLRSAKDLEEEERSLTARSASSELSKLVSQLQVEYHELTAPIVAMKPNVYFLCTCHLGRPMEMGRIYVDRQSNLPPVGDVPWILVCMWALLIGSAVNSVVQRMGAGKSQTAVASARPAKGPRGTVPAAMTSFRAPGGIREYDGRPQGVARGGHGQISEDGAVPDASRWSALAPGTEEVPGDKTSDDAALLVEAPSDVDQACSDEASMDQGVPAFVERAEAPSDVDQACSDEASMDQDVPAFVETAEVAEQAPSDVDQACSDEASMDQGVPAFVERAEVAEQAPSDVDQANSGEASMDQGAPAFVERAEVAEQAYGQRMAADSTPDAPLPVEQVVSDAAPKATTRRAEAVAEEDASSGAASPVEAAAIRAPEASKVMTRQAEAEATLQSGQFESPSQAGHRRPLLGRDIPEDWIERLAIERKEAIAVALRRRPIVPSIGLVAVGPEIH